MFLLGGKGVVAVDIGSSTIKVVELEVGKSSCSIKSFSTTPLPTGIISAGDIADPGALAEVIKGALASAKVGKKSAAVGVWGSAVIVKRVSIARVDAKLVAEQVRFEAEQYIPFDLSTVNLDYAVLSDTGSESMDVLLIAAQKDLVLKYAEAIEGAGLRCGIIDVESFAVANCFNHNYGTQGADAIAVLNIGASKTNVVVLKSGEVIFARDVVVGGGNYTADISKQMGVTLEEAEALKVSACQGKEAPAEVLAAINETNEVVVEEIHRSFDFFAATVPDTPIKRMFVTGGASLTTGLIDGLKATLQLEVDRLENFSKVQVSSKMTETSDLKILNAILCVAIGLGLRKMGDR